MAQGLKRLSGEDVEERISPGEKVVMVAGQQNAGEEDIGSSNGGRGCMFSNNERESLAWRSWQMKEW